MNLRDAERLLSNSPDHRVLKRIPPSAAWPLKASGDAVRRALFVDVETTGLDYDTDEVIELALLPFDYDLRTGEIVSVLEDKALSALRQPSFPIPPEGTRIHGITDADVAGKVIDAAAVETLVTGADLIVAHNAGFDRPMVEKHWSIFETKNWACSLSDIDWRDEGLGTGKLDYLLMRQGWFFDGHRALGDALAGAFLLSLPLPVSRRPALSALLESARRPLKAIRAEGAAFEKRDALKKRGYRWDAGDGDKRPKAWWIVTTDPDAEIAWLNTEIYPSARAIPVTDLPPTRRYSARLWENTIA